MCPALPSAALTTELKADFLGVGAVGKDVSERMYENRASLVGTAGNYLLNDNIQTRYSVSHTSLLSDVMVPSQSTLPHPQRLL